MDALPDDSFTTSLSTTATGGVGAAIRDTVYKVFDNNGGQPQVDDSKAKLKFTKKHGIVQLPSH